MSGGHITGYHLLPSIADEIERLAIEQPELGPDVLGRYRLAAEHARRAYEAIRAVDYLEGGGYGRESFVQAWDALVVDPASALRAEVQRLQRELDAAIDERNAWRSGDQDSRIEADRLRGEVQRLTEEARRSDAGRVEVPEPPESAMPHVGRGWTAEVDQARYRGFEDGVEWARENARIVPATHQPSADVVVVPREEWEVIEEILEVSAICANEGGTDRKCCMQTDDHHIPLTRLRAIRSSTNHDAQTDRGEG